MKNPKATNKMLTDYETSQDISALAQKDGRILVRSCSFSDRVVRLFPLFVNVGVSPTEIHGFRAKYNCAIRQTTSGLYLTHFDSCKAATLIRINGRLVIAVDDCWKPDTDGQQNIIDAVKDCIPVGAVHEESMKRDVKRKLLAYFAEGHALSVDSAEVIKALELFLERLNSRHPKGLKLPKSDVAHALVDMQKRFVKIHELTGIYFNTDWMKDICEHYRSTRKDQLRLDSDHKRAIRFAVPLILLTITQLAKEYPETFASVVVKCIKGILEVSHDIAIRTDGSSFTVTYIASSCDSLPVWNKKKKTLEWDRLLKDFFTEGDTAKDCNFWNAGEEIRTGLGMINSITAQLKNRS